MIKTDSSSSKFIFWKHLFNRIAQKLMLLRKQYLIFSFFLAVSTLAWYIRALNEFYTTELEYPVRYVNLPPNRILSQSPPEHLTLRIRADGYTILAYKLRIKRALRFDVNSFSMYSLTPDSTSLYLLTKHTYDKLTSEISEPNKDIKILGIAPDTLFFNFTRVRKKKVPVRENIKYSPTMYARQHMLSGQPKIEPDSIEITGPTFMLDTIKSILTEEIILKNEDDTVIKSIHLSKPYNKISYPHRKVKVLIPIDRYTESEFEVPINTINVPENYSIKTFPATIHIRYLITLSNFNKVSPASFFAYVDYNSIDPDMNSRLRVKLDSLPSFVHEVKIKPVYVEFLIEK